MLARRMPADFQSEALKRPIGSRKSDNSMGGIIPPNGPPVPRTVVDRERSTISRPLGQLRRPHSAPARQRKPSPASPARREGCEGTRIVLGERRGIGVALGGTQPQPRNAFGKRHGANHAIENRDTDRLLQIARKI